MKKPIITLPLVLGFSSIAVPASGSVVTTYTDRSSFEAALLSPSTETFNSFLSEAPFHTTRLDVGPFTLSMTGSPSTSSPRNSIDLPPAQFTVFDIDGTNIANVLTALGDSLFFDFDSPTTAFGADFGNFNDGFLRTQIVVDGETLSPGGASGASFYGFLTDTPFSTVEFRAVDNDGFGIDNVTVESSAIPEPTSSLGLCLLLSASLFSRKKRSA